MPLSEYGHLYLLGWGNSVKQLLHILYMLWADGTVQTSTLSQTAGISAVVSAQSNHSVTHSQCEVDLQACH